MGPPHRDWTAVDGDPEAKASSAEVSAVDLADLVLTAAARRRSLGVQLRPEASGYVLTLGDPRSQAMPLDASLGVALSVRLGILARLDPWGAGARFGLLRLRTGAGTTEFVVELDRSPQGDTVEVRRISDAADLEAAHAAYGAHEDDETLHHVGAYTVLGELGRGGMGVVYRARHDETGRVVAIKVLHRELAADPRLASQFVREGRAASFANHPGIVNVTDFGKLPSGRAYLVMELVESGTLEAVLASGALPPRRAVGIARRIVAALAAAHVRGVIHRDLKPSNVFLEPEDQVKIGDFGAAKVISPMPESTATQHGVVVGTPFYMSPEQARGQPTDERTDIYALGCILFRMISGRPPYEGETVMDIVSAHMGNPVPVVESPYAPLPDGLVSLVAKAMSKRAEDRPQSAVEMGADLDRALSALPPASRA
jgi:eukaryotic-like serine/threonine-protein kinase